jgi:hypothetical protein
MKAPAAFWFENVVALMLLKARVFGTIKHEDHFDSLRQANVLPLEHPFILKISRVTLFYRFLLMLESRASKFFLGFGF